MSTKGFNQSVPAEIAVALELQKIVAEKEYNKLTCILNKIEVKNDGVLDVEECKQEGMGAESYLTITFTDGSVVKSDIDEFWDNISTEESAMGMWQVFLLKNLRTYLPLFWHSNYDKRDYIYTQKQMTIINTKPAIGDKPIENLDYSRYDVAPRIELRGDRYVISACYWSDFEGLIRQEMQLAKNVIGEIVFLNEKIIPLFPYNCGILF